MSRILVLIFVVAACTIAILSTENGVAVKSSCTPDGCLVVASSSLMSTFLSPIFFLALICYPQQSCLPVEGANAGPLQRFSAFIIDFMVVLLIIAPLGALPILIVESMYAGDFSWSFERSYSRESDPALIIPAILLSFLALFTYFWQHAEKGRSTVGQYVLAYRIEPAQHGAPPSYGLRVLAGFLGMCVWPVSLLFYCFDKDKMFWWDYVSNSKAVPVKALKI